MDGVRGIKSEGLRTRDIPKIITFQLNSKRTPLVINSGDILNSTRWGNFLVLLVEMMIFSSPLSSRSRYKVGYHGCFISFIPECFAGTRMDMMVKMMVRVTRRRMVVVLHSGGSNKN